MRKETEKITYASNCFLYHSGGCLSLLKAISLNHCSVTQGKTAPEADQMDWELAGHQCSESTSFLAAKLLATSVYTKWLHIHVKLG